MPSKCTMKKTVEIISIIVILGGSTFFGLKGMPVEMGLSIVAGAMAIALVNLDKFSRIKGAGFEAELRDKIEAVIEKETEPTVLGEEDKTVPNIDKIDANTRLIVSALQHPEYTWRYIGGLKQDTKLRTGEIERSIKWLKEHGYVKQSLGKHGTIWNLTQDGRYLSAVIDFS